MTSQPTPSATSQPAEVGVLHGGDERAEVLLHVRGRARGAVVQVLVPPRARRVGVGVLGLHRHRRGPDVLR